MPMWRLRADTNPKSVDPNARYDSYIPHRAPGLRSVPRNDSSRFKRVKRLAKTMVRNRRNLRSSQGIALQVGREVTIMNSLPAIVFPPTVCFPPLPIDATPMLRATSYSLLLFAAALLLAPNSASAKKPAALEGPIVFETHVRPIFKAHCFHCHGEAGDVQGGLDVRLVRLLSKGGESGPAFTAGDHKKSFLFERIESQEMPPGEKKLSPTEIATIARWIDQGAKTLKPEPETISEITDDDRAFWSFQPIVRPPLPKVRDAARVATPIDAFLLAELEQKNLGFSLQADAATLIRRLYFDLLGLPPTPAEVAAFVKDKSPQAYEKLVDKLLASPHYGERWGRHWLDVAGYADSDGYTPLDPVRKHVYKYRDYVIRSFNDDKPWNEFIVEQLAGDELVSLPYNGKTGAELDRLIATGFLRMGPDGTSDTSVDRWLATMCWLKRSRSCRPRCSACRSVARNVTVTATTRFRRPTITPSARCSNRRTIRSPGGNRNRDSSRTARPSKTSRSKRPTRRSPRSNSNATRRIRN